MIKWNKLRGRLNGCINFTTVTLIMLFTFLICIATIAPPTVLGDGTIYYMQTQSIAYDHDIQYQQQDLDRVLKHPFSYLPQGLILIKTGEGEYFYAKEFSYALFAVPFFLLFGNDGFAIFNAVMFFLMIYMGFIYLRNKNDYTKSLLFSIIFFLCSVSFIYIFLTHADIYSMFLIMLGFFLWLQGDNYRSKQDGGKTPINGSHDKVKSFLQNPTNLTLLAVAVFGVATFAKAPNIFCIIPILIWEVYNKRFRTFIMMIILFILTITIFYGCFYLLTGQITPYGGMGGGERLGFHHTPPFMDSSPEGKPIGKTGYLAEENIKYVVRGQSIRLTIINSFYFMFGRFSGIVFYHMPAIIALCLMLEETSSKFHDSTSKKRGIKKFFNAIDFKKVLILVAIFLNILFYIRFLPFNYVGGAGAFGNRYFYIFPAFLFLVDTIKFNKKVLVLIIIAIIFIFPFHLQVNPWSKIPYYPCGHATEFPYTALPIEYTLLDNLGLWADKYSYDDYVLFRTDKNAYQFEKSGFWTRGHSSTKLLFASSEYLNHIKVNVTNGMGENAVTIIFGVDKKKIIFTEDKETRELIFSPNPTFQYDHHYIYKIKIKTTSGFSPMISGSKDSRYLGTFVQYPVKI